MTSKRKQPSLSSTNGQTSRTSQTVPEGRAGPTGPTSKPNNKTRTKQCAIAGSSPGPTFVPSHLDGFHLPPYPLDSSTTAVTTQSWCYSDATKVFLLSTPAERQESRERWLEVIRLILNDFFPRLITLRQALPNQAVLQSPLSHRCLPAAAASLIKCGGGGAPAPLNEVIPEMLGIMQSVQCKSARNVGYSVPITLRDPLGSNMRGLLSPAKDKSEQDTHNLVASILAKTNYSGHQGVQQLVTRGCFHGLMDRACMESGASMMDVVYYDQQDTWRRLSTRPCPVFATCQGRSLYPHALRLAVAMPPDKVVLPLVTPTCPVLGVSSHAVEIYTIALYRIWLQYPLHLLLWTKAYILAWEQSNPVADANNPNATTLQRLIERVRQLDFPLLDPIVEPQILMTTDGHPKAVDVYGIYVARYMQCLEFPVQARSVQDIPLELPKVSSKFTVSALASWVSKQTCQHDRISSALLGEPSSETPMTRTEEDTPSSFSVFSTSFSSRVMPPPARRRVEFSPRKSRAIVTSTPVARDHTDTTTTISTGTIESQTKRHRRGDGNDWITWPAWQDQVSLDDNAYPDIPCRDGH